MKFYFYLFLTLLPLHADEIIITPIDGKGEAVRVDVSGPAKIALGGKVYHIEPASKVATQIKAEKIMLPSLNFEETSMEEAVEFLRQRSAESYRTEGKTRGLNYVMSGDFPKVIDELRLRNVSFHEAHRLIAMKVGATVEYRPDVVMFVAKK